MIEAAVAPGPIASPGPGAVACPVCGGAFYDPLAVVQAFPARDRAPTVLFVRCHDCELIYAADPLFGQRAGEPIRRVVRPSPVRDRMHALARRIGRTATRPGTEPAGPAATTGVQGSADAPAVLVGVLESDADPIGSLRRLRAEMSASDDLMVITGNGDSLLMQAFGRRHACLYDFPANARVFGRRALERAARAAGFQVEEAYTRPCPEAWTTSIRSFLVDWGASDRTCRFASGAAAELVASTLEAFAKRSDRAALLVARLRPVAAADATDERRRAPFVGRGARPPIAILGAGVAGLTAARVLRQHGVPVVVLEAGDQIAGLARSYRRDDGFSNDFGAHFITNRFAAALDVGSRCRTVHRFGEAVRLGGRTYGYPFGLIRSPQFALSALRARLAPGGAPFESVAELYRTQFGTRLAEEVAFPLVEAWSGVRAEELAPTVSPPQLDRGMLHVVKLKLASRLSGRAVANGFSRAQPENPHVFHVYPVDGVSVLTERLAEGMDDVIELRSRVEAVYVDEGRVRGIRVAGADRDVSAVISSAPVHVLPRMIRGTDVLQPLGRFRYRPFTLVNMRFDVRPVLSEVCTWIPDRRFTFFRLTEVPLAMPWLAPAGKTMLTVDIGCEVGDEIWTMDEEALAGRCLDELEELFPGVRRHYLGATVLRTPVAHPVYLREYEAERVEFARGLPVEGLHNIGRNGEFAHVLMEDVYWRTRRKILTDVLGAA